jgi:paraquat-inducible protein B
VEIDPSLLRPEAAEKIVLPDSEFLNDCVRRGLRASLKTGSLLTGAKFVDMDYYPDSPAAQMGRIGDFPSLPTIPGGFEQLETKVTAILDKIKAVDIDGTVKKFAATADEATATMKEIRETAASARKTLDSEEFAQLPADVRTALASVEKSVSSVGPDGSIQGDLLRTLEELRAALRSMKSLTNSIDEKPNSLLFGRDSSGNPIPKAPKANR